MRAPVRIAPPSSPETTLPALPGMGSRRRACNAEGRTGDCPGPRKDTATRRNATRGGGGPSPQPPPLRRLSQIFFWAFGQTKCFLWRRISLGQKFSSAPLKTQHHRRGGGGQSKVVYRNDSGGQPHHPPRAPKPAQHPTPRVGARPTPQALHPHTATAVHKQGTHTEHHQGPMTPHPNAYHTHNNQGHTYTQHRRDAFLMHSREPSPSRPRREEKATQT